MIINISAYKFVAIAEAELPVLRTKLKSKAIACDLKGTILLSTEGINLFIAGLRENIDQFIQYLETFPEFQNLPYKESPSTDKPFKRMLVRIKKEIIAFGREEVDPESYTSTHLAPEELKRWYDENKDMIILDTRNDYEVRLGTFENAIDLKIQSFRDFPQAIANLSEEIKQKPVVTFCTGGVRCEKAAPFLEQQGFKEVYQLDGGILNYFEACGGAHYSGECFVFDKRVAVNSQLQETGAIQCYACRSPLDEQQQQASSGQCPYCGDGNVGEQINS
jgi:UPF0176 protein